MRKNSIFTPIENGLKIESFELVCEHKNMVVGCHEHTDSCYKKIEIRLNYNDVSELKKLLKNAICRYSVDHVFGKTYLMQWK